MAPGEMIRSANKRYREWRSAQSPNGIVATETELDVKAPLEIELGRPGEVVARAVYDQALETARTEIDQHIENLGAYDFQNLVAELLRGMGYHFFLAPKEE
jgi:restriction system protein